MPSMYTVGVPLTASTMAHGPASGAYHPRLEARRPAVEPVRLHSDVRKNRPMENLMTLILTRLAAVTFGLLSALLKR